MMNSPYIVDEINDRLNDMRREAENERKAQEIQRKNRKHKRLFWRTR